MGKSLRIRNDFLERPSVPKEFHNFVLSIVPKNLHRYFLWSESAEKMLEGSFTFLESSDGGGELRIRNFYCLAAKILPA